MKTYQLLVTALLSCSLLSGCSDLLSDSDKEELASFLDGYAEEESQEVSTSEALEKNYIEETEVTADDAVGSARIGGEIAADSLGRNLAQIASRSIGSRAQLASRAIDTLSAGDFSISFINGKGQKVELDISTLEVLINQPSTGNPQFIIEGVGDGINYIVDITVTVDGTVLNLKTVAFVPEGASKSEKAIVDPISTVIAQAVQEKVTNGFFETGGDSFSQTYISDLTETMVAVIAEVIANNPDLSVSDFEAAISSDEGIDNLVGKLLSDPDVSGGLNKLEDAAVADTFAVPDSFDPNSADDKEQARNIVYDLFNQDEKGGEGGAPQFFIDFFGDQYAQGAMKTVNQVITHIRWC